MELSLPTIALAALGRLAPYANAVTSYAFTFNGTLIHFLDAFECPGLMCPGDGAPVQLPWSGDVSVEVSGAGDGVLAGSRCLARPDARRRHRLPHPGSTGWLATLERV